MSTNLQIITDALREISVISEVETPSAEQGTHALRQMNRMIESWTENGIELGYFKQSSTTDTCPIPEWSEEGVSTNLAVRLAPTYGASISIELSYAADNSYRLISRKSLTEILKPANMDHLPAGRNGRYDIERDL